MISNCSNSLDLKTSRNKLKKHSVTKNCSDDLKNSQSSALNFKSFSQSLEQFFLTVRQDNFNNKIQFQNITTCFKSAQGSFY